MGMETGVNGTNVLTEIHPCYKIDVSYVLIRKLSAVCVLFHIFLGSLSIITVCGNLLVIISIIYFRQLHTPTNYLILSLAVADLLVGVLVFPLSIVFSLSSCLYHSSLYCKVRDGLDIMLSTASIFNLCSISIDRYYAVCQPLTYTTKITGHAVVIMVLFTWTASAAVATGMLTAESNLEKCKEGCLTEVVLAKTMGKIVSFYFPVIVMLCIYLKIFLVAQKQARSIQSTKSGATIRNMERKATVTLAIIMGVFLICWAPFFLCMTVVSFSNSVVSAPAMETLIWLTLSNSMLNPFIYAFFYSWFRSAFRMIISGKIFRGDFANSKLQ